MRNLVIGNSRYGVHMTFFRRGITIHIEFKGKTYGGSYTL